MIRLRRPAPLPAYEATTPLINVAFLLMAFFMLIGRMDATAPFEVQPPVSAAGTSLPQGGTTLSIARDGSLALDGVAVALPALLSRLFPEAGPAQVDFLRINADAETPVGQLLPIIAALEAGGLDKIALVVTPPVAPR